MDTDEKLKIIRNWCYRFDISHDRAWGKIYHDDNSGYEFTLTCAKYEDMIDEGYKMVSDLIWNHINRKI